MAVTFAIIKKWRSIHWRDVYKRQLFVDAACRHPTREAVQNIRIQIGTVDGHLLAVLFRQPDGCGQKAERVRVVFRHHFVNGMLLNVHRRLHILFCKSLRRKDINLRIIVRHKRTLIRQVPVDGTQL